MQANEAAQNCSSPPGTVWEMPTLRPIRGSLFSAAGFALVGPPELEPGTRDSDLTATSNQQQTETKPKEPGHRRRTQSQGARKNCNALGGEKAKDDVRPAELVSVTRPNIKCLYGRKCSRWSGTLWLRGETTDH